MLNAFHASNDYLLDCSHETPYSTYSMNTRFSNLSEYLLQTLKNSVRGLLVRRVLIVDTDTLKSETRAIIDPLIDYCRELGAELEFVCKTCRSPESTLQQWMYDCVLVIDDCTTAEELLFTTSTILYVKKLADTLKSGGSLLVLSFQDNRGNKKNTLFQELSKWINMVTTQAGLSMRMQDIHESCIIIVFRKV